MSDSSIMSIREMIDTAFGDSDVNVVNFKLIQTILYLIARQLRVLERRVSIDVGPGFGMYSTSSLSVTEIKMHATVPKKKKRTITGTDKGGAGGTGTGKTEKKSKDRGPTSGEYKDDGSDDAKGRTKSSQDKRGFSGKDSAQKSATRGADKSTTDEYTSGKSGKTSGRSDTYTGKETSDSGTTRKRTGKADETLSEHAKDRSDKSPSQKSTTEQSSSLKTSTDKSQKSSTEKSSDKSSSGKSGGKTSAEKSSDKTSTEKSSDKTSSGKTSTEKSSGKTSTERSSDKTSTQRSSDKSSGEKSSDRPDKTSDQSDRTTSTSTSDKRTAPGAAKSKDYHKLLEKIEEHREKVLRVIHQRVDSFEERDKTPTPMASMESTEIQYEKLLVVERVPSSEARAAAGRLPGDKSQGRTPRLSIVTQEQFLKLAAAVHELQTRFAPIGTPGFPDNTQLMEDLRRGASLTDAMAALQLSARLEASEKALEQMMGVVTEIARRTPGFDLEMAEQTKSHGPPTEVIFGPPGPSSQTPPPISHKSAAFIQPPPRSAGQAVSTHAPQRAPSTESVQFSTTSHQQQPEETAEPFGADIGKEKRDVVTHEELDNALEDLYEEFIKTVNSLTTKSNVNAEKALKTVSQLEGRLESSLDLGTKMEDLEAFVAEYAEQINILDTGLSSKMTNYQEQLTQMQHDLETGLENMAESIANATGDPAAVAELNSQFTSLQLDFDNTTLRQKELKEGQTALALDLQSLWKQIELLRDIKSDREEVADALRDKAGLAALNGLVSLQQFDAVRGDFEKRIGMAYDKFNNQEIVWQKAIDDLIRELSEKADWIQVVSLRDDINRNLDILRSRIHAMMEIVGEPQAATISRRIHRDANCLSCSTPAYMEITVPQTVPALPGLPSARQPAVGAEAPQQPKDDGDHVTCYPGLPIPHPRDPRSHVCQRYCGGSHTIVPNTIPRAPPGMIINPIPREITTGLGTDGKSYKMDEPLPQKPCIPCNIPCKAPKVTTPEPSIHEQVAEMGDAGSNMTPPDFRQASEMFAGTVAGSVSVTPPPPMDDEY